MEKKTYEIELYGQTWKLELRKGKYMTNDDLAIEAFSENGESFTTLTVNLGWPLPDNYAFIDTNNNDWAEKFLKKNKIAEDTGKRCSSGYCTFPLFVFNEDVLAGMADL